MSAFLFTGRVTFICNLFFILCLLIRHTHFTVPQAVTEFVVITGWVMSVLANVVFAIGTASLLIKKKAAGIPVWLIAFNLLCFVIQIVYRILLAR